MNEAYFQNGIREELLNSIETYKEERELIKDIGEIDYKLWSNEYQMLSLNYDADSYYEYSECVLDFYIGRLEWIDDVMQSELK